MFIQSDFNSEWESHCDQELWTAFGAGKRKALSTLFLRFYGSLFRYGMNFYPCEETVKDSIQTLFLRLWKKKETLGVPDSINSYLFASLRRIMLRNKEKRLSMDNRHNEFLQRTQGEVSNTETRIISREDKEERKRLFQKALKNLTGRQREALLLRLDSGLSNQEIADIMEVSNKRVRNLIYEAIKKLKKTNLEKKPNIDILIKDPFFNGSKF